MHHGQEKRALRNATVHVDGQTYGREKDHKESNGGIKMRPVLDAMEGPKKVICDIYSDVLAAVIESKDSDVMCSSTEELIEAIEENNKYLERKYPEGIPKRVVGSMDAKSLYTSLTADITAQIIKEEVINSKIKFQNVDIKELGICLRKNLGKQYVEENG